MLARTTSKMWKRPSYRQLKLFNSNNVSLRGSSKPRHHAVDLLWTNLALPADNEHTFPGSNKEEL